MKIVFAGSPEFAVPVLERLILSGKEVVAVITQPDRPFGRKKVLTPTPVKKRAMEHGIPVYDFEKIRAHADEVKSLGADIMITCAYGQILPRSVLEAFPAGVWNLHASLLPKFRGASPIQSAILAGERYTGVTVMKTDIKMDTGDILLVKRCEVGDSTCGELEKVLSSLAADAATDALDILEKGEPQLLVQDEAAATYCKKIGKEDCKINFSDTAENVVRLIRAMSPQPLAYCSCGGNILNIVNAQVSTSDVTGEVGEVVSLNAKAKSCEGATGIFTVKCGEGAVDIISLVPSGGKFMYARDFINGRKIKAGDVLE